MNALWVQGRFGTGQSNEFAGQWGRWLSRQAPEHRENARDGSL